MVEEPQVPQPAGSQIQPVQPVLGTEPEISTQQIQASTENYHSSEAEVWYLKTIEFGEGENRRRTQIITQNYNGYVFISLFVICILTGLRTSPCSFIAICTLTLVLLFFVQFHQTDTFAGTQVTFLFSGAKSLFFL